RPRRQVEHRRRLGHPGLLAAAWACRKADGHGARRRVFLWGSREPATRQPQAGQRRRHGGPALYSALTEPPSTSTLLPVMYEAAGDTRKVATRPNSAGSPRRPMGIEAAEAFW